LPATPFVIGRHAGEAFECSTAEHGERRVKVAATGPNTNYATPWCGPRMSRSPWNFATAIL
jgi:hypothetical protein